ncbi:MAG TPA: pyridoxamine 5'-phosphate oxidase family protein [Sphingobium sp.]|nr:pyridoxamine 5'-phosphate oxidase family protein [Sphingobium sp.]
MVQRTIEQLAKTMKDIDFAMLSTHAEGGHISARPMSNNRDVEYDGDSYYFTTDDTLMVKDIEREATVGLSFQGASGLLNQRPLFVAIEGRAELIRDRARFEAHWNSDLERWFDRGVDTPGLVMIKVHAERAHYWDGADEGEIGLGAGSGIH